MCHWYKLDSLNWCCLSLPCSDSEKFGTLMTIFLKFYSCSNKNVQSDRVYVSVGIVRISHV